MSAKWSITKSGARQESVKIATTSTRMQSIETQPASVSSLLLQILPVFFCMITLLCSRVERKVIKLSLLATVENEKC